MLPVPSRGSEQRRAITSPGYTSGETGNLVGLKIEGRAYRLIHYSRSADRMLGRWIETVEGKELNPQVAIHKERLASLCQARGIKRLAVFGSALRVEFGPEFDGDRMLVLSLVKDVEIIGEAAYRTSEAARRDLPLIPWADVIAMRHRLVHAYFDINLDVLWQTLVEDLPELISLIETVLPPRAE